MTLIQIKKQATSLSALLEDVAIKEAAIQRGVADFLADNRGGVREIARRLGFSPQYICDVQHGRRKISAEFIKRLERL